MNRKKSDYEKALDEFYQISDDLLEEYEEAYNELAKSDNTTSRVLKRDKDVPTWHNAKKEEIEELFTLFYEVLTEKDKEKLKKKHGNEWTHIENHFHKIKKDGK